VDETDELLTLVTNFNDQPKKNKLFLQIFSNSEFESIQNFVTGIIIQKLKGEFNGKLSIEEKER